MVTIYEELRNFCESSEGISPLEYVALNCDR